MCSGQSNLRANQPARPMWSGCMWVATTRATGRPASGPDSAASQAAIAAGMFRPVSTTVHASPSLSAQTLMWSSVNGRARRRRKTPGATSQTSPG